MSQILCPVIYNQDFVTKKIVDSKHADGHTGIQLLSYGGTS